jgi:CTP:molybdopterin cytidylyltransferase MocA
MSTMAIILAAESGAEFSGSKYLVPVHGEPMLQTVISDASSWPVDEVLVVLGADADEIIATIDFRGMTIVIDPSWSEGAASPIRAALDLASRDRSIRRCVVARGDQPGIRSEIVGALVEAAIEGDADSVVPKYRYAVGWPVVLDSSLWEQLLGSEGPLDLLDFIASHASVVEEVWFDSLPPVPYTTPQELP